jgi:hypothetical protein
LRHDKLKSLLQKSYQTTSAFSSLKSSAETKNAFAAWWLMFYAESKSGRLLSKF